MCMNRIEFMKELEYLLQDIADADKTDAIDYYRDYLEEAGDENEQEVLTEFGSPERIAAMIRSDLCGGMETAGEFTDSGFQDSRFEDPRYRLAKRMDLPEVKAPFDRADKTNTAGHTEAKKADGKSWGKIIVVIILVCLASPLLLGVGSGLLGMLLGMLAAVVSIIFAAAVLIAVLTFVFFVLAVGLIGYGMANLLVIPAQGLLAVGVGIICLGLGLLSLILAVLFYGKLVPAIVRGCVNQTSRIFHRKGGANG